jgi:hypothetical protein
MMLPIPPDQIPKFKAALQLARDIYIDDAMDDSDADHSVIVPLLIDLIDYIEENYG